MALEEIVSFSEHRALNLIKLITTTSILDSVTIRMPIMATFLQYTDVSVKLGLHDLGKI